MQASTDLLIGQWRNADNLKKTIDIFLSVIEQEIEQAVQDLIEMTSIDTANGVWLERIGERLGLNRPYQSGTNADTNFFGFDDAGIGFDQSSINNQVGLTSLTPISDIFYRKLLRIKIISNSTQTGNYADMLESIALIDQSAILTDEYNMTFDIKTDETANINLSDKFQVLPRVAGVRLVTSIKTKFGYDEAGLGFDQGSLR